MRGLTRRSAKASSIERHQAHLLKAYDVDFLCEMIRRRKDNPAANAFGVNTGTLISSRG